MTSTTVYATAAQLRAQPNMTGANDDTVLELLLSAASRAVDGYCNRVDDGFLAPEALEERTFVGDGTESISIPECVELGTISVRSRGVSAWTAVDDAYVLGYAGSAQRPNFNRFPYTGILLTTGTFPLGLHPDYPLQPGYPTVKVSGRFGYADAVPDVVVTATIVQASRWFKRGQSFWADTIASDSMGTASFRRSVDPDVKMMLDEARLRLTLYG
jgi:hypothetical protein